MNDSRSRKAHTTPSFSSTLLHQIDGEAFKGYREKPPKAEDGDQTRTFVRACLVDKWIQKSKSQKPAPNSDKFSSDVMFFSSTSSSNSDSSGALSSSDTEFFGSQTEPKVSCFSSRPKPIKTGALDRKPTEDEDPVKAKSRALRLYANLKQPISPGGRLTNFINSLFSNAAGKKPKNDPGKDRFQSVCSSASSYSRSCLSKSSPGSREMMRGGSTQRMVRFNPVSLIVDEDSMACGRGKYERNPPVADLKFRETLIVDEDEVDDGMSDASSDLFELDHMAMFGNKCEELPVYETTRMETNRVIASRLIR